jgi:putative DNA primase/helicase
MDHPTGLQHEIENPPDPLPDFPNELKILPRWVVWRSEIRKHKSTKVPYDATTGAKADTTDPSTWCDYHMAVSASKQYSGIGCVLLPPYVGIDLDNCRDGETGEIELWAKNILREVSSYTEVSPSGGGVHIWTKATLPPGRRKVGRAEMYDKGRYLTVTGKWMSDVSRSIETRDLNSLHSRIAILDPEEGLRPMTKELELSSSTKLDSLMAGRWQESYPSQSEADAALCVLLASKHGCDAIEIDADFRRSRLMRPKWDTARGTETYGSMTIRNAVDHIRSGEPSQRVRPEISTNWRSAFKSYEEMDRGEMQFLIDGVFPYGINFIGGLSDSGKTWLTLSAAKAIVFGQRFLGHFDVPHPVPVIYLIPESGERTFRGRLERMGLTSAGESFICRTMQDGPILGLQSPELLEAVRELKPAIILDTVARFNTANDENNAAENRALANGMFGLLTAGARGIIAIHHSAKSSAKELMTLENVLRGSGDLGALSDAVYGLRCRDKEKLEVLVQCVKARDFQPVKPFFLQGRPYIDQTGDLAMLTGPSNTNDDIRVRELARAINADPEAKLSSPHRCNWYLVSSDPKAGRTGWIH